MCSTNNDGRNRRCYVCDQKRPFEIKFKLKLKKINWSAVEDSFFTKLISWYKEIVIALISLMGICLAALITLRAVDGKLPEVLNTLVLLWENVKEVAITSFTKNPVTLWKGIKWAPFIEVKENFLCVFGDVGMRFTEIFPNFLELFPGMGKHFTRLFKGILLVIARVRDGVILLLAYIIAIIKHIVESIAQFFKMIGV